MAYATIADLRDWLEDQVPETAQQTVTLTGATGGSFPLTYDTNTTDPIPWNATATAVRVALTTLPALAAYAQANGDSVLRVRGRRGGPWHIEFLAPLGDDAELLLASATGLTGPAPAVTVTLTTDAILQRCLDDATGLIDAILQPIRFLGYSAPEARPVPGFGGTVLYLPPHLPGSVTAVATGSTLLDDYTAQPSVPDVPIEHLYRATGWAQTLPRATWDVWRSASPLDRDRLAFWDGIGGAYTVTARWGYGDPPAAVQELTKELAVNIWRSKARGLFTEVQGADDGGFIRYLGGLNKTQQAILAGIKAQLHEQAI